ncbi:MAG TPA: DJ-1/PfpI family protein [Solirubrobacterales bacterium]|nr:DJ-1/PfpI family protein [Solirubrobacterales bacterium]
MSNQLDGKRIAFLVAKTSWPSLETDIRNAGGTRVDEPVVVDQGLVTSRKPDDLEQFNAKLVEEFCEGVHEEQRRQTVS